MTTDLISDDRSAIDWLPAGNSAESPAAESHTTAKFELPILFRLADVSRPKAGRPRTPPTGAAVVTSASDLKLTAAPAKPAQTLIPDWEPLPTSLLSTSYAPAALDPSKLWSPSGTSLLENAAVASESLAVADAAHQSTTETLPSEAKATGNPSAAAVVTAASGESVTADKTAKPIQSTKPSEAPKAAEAQTSPAKRREQREQLSKRREPAKKSDWFTAHGRLIAVGFVIALAATIVIARNKKQPVTPAADDSWAMQHPGDAANHLVGDGPKTEVPNEASSKLASEAQASTQTNEASPAATEAMADSGKASSPSAAPAQVDLLPPTLPQQTIAEAPPTAIIPPAAVTTTPPAPSASPSSDPLFQWPRQEARVAARPESPAAAEASAAYNQVRNPGEVMNPYTRTPQQAAAAVTVETPAGTVASRSPYVLPGSPQDTSPVGAPPTSVYGQAPTAGYGGAPAPSAGAATGYGATGSYSPAPANQPTSVYSPAPAYSPAPNYTSAGGTAAVPPTTPSPYLPSAATVPPPAAGQPAPTTGAPSAGYPNTQQPPRGYRNEPTGSSLY
jgi:hypothetical protein